MFHLNDTFRCFDDNLQPYSFSVERHTDTPNLHAGVMEDGFHLKSVGNRHLLHTPAFETGVFSMRFCFQYMEEFDPQFSVLFQYHPEGRFGYGIRFCYHLYGALEISLIHVQDTLERVLERRSFEGVSLDEREELILTLHKTHAGVTCQIRRTEGELTADAAFDSKIVSGGKANGRLAIERDNFIGELILKEISFETGDALGEMILLPRTSVEIPLINGGDLPYIVSWEVRQVETMVFLEVSLDGGCKRRPVNREDRKGQYVAEKDFMTDPYAGISVCGKDYKCNLLKGRRAFIDPNIYWDCQKKFFEDTELPLQGTFLLWDTTLTGSYEGKSSIITDPERIQLFFGYEKLACSGYAAQEGGHEFRYAADGTLVYEGAAADGRDQWEIFSPFDKLALSLIPDHVWHREAIIEHLKFNHYFDTSEQVQFILSFRTSKNPEYFRVHAKVSNIYETEILEERPVILQVHPGQIPSDAPTDQVLSFGQPDWDWIWKDKTLQNDEAFLQTRGYHCLHAHAVFGSLPEGVYKICFDISFGGKVYERATKVFEVFDQHSKEAPALASGLPYTFSMPNEQKWLMSNCFDLWSPVRSCDGEHFISCIMDTPIEAMTRRIWEVAHIFKRELFVWLGRRTCNDHRSEKYQPIRAHADYLFYGFEDDSDDWLSSASVFPFLAGQFWQYNRINLQFQRNLLKRFVRETTGAAGIIHYEGDESEVSRESFVLLMQHYGHAWMHLVNEEILRLFRQQNEEWKRENPSLRRTFYGPVSQYPSPVASSHRMLFFGYPEDERLYQEIYTGFSIFEDYPFSCAYQTYRGPFAVMTVLLHAPGIRLYPEQYGGSEGGCIDGAVKYAHAPMGAYSLPMYKNETLSYEYVYNTPHLMEDGYHYWNTYGFHRTFSDQNAVALMKSWRFVAEYPPERPLRAMAFLAEFAEADDRFDVYPREKEDWYYWTNKSELGIGLIHECSREAGLPNGFGVRFDTLHRLSAAACDVLVLPSLAGASQETTEEIRRLYQEGVNLVAVSDITGLEDLFEVTPTKQNVAVSSVWMDGEGETVAPMEVTVSYAPNGASSQAWLMGTVKEDHERNCRIPVVFQTKRTMLVAADVRAFGSSDARKISHDSLGDHLTGTLLPKHMQQWLRELSRPLVFGDNVGVTLFETKQGKTVLLAIDYTPWDNASHEMKEAVIHVNLDRITDVKSEREVFIGTKNGHVQELRFEIRPHEAVFFELI